LLITKISILEKKLKKSLITSIFNERQKNKTCLTSVNNVQNILHNFVLYKRHMFKFVKEM